VALNRAVAIGLARGPQAGLDALDEIGTPPELSGYAYLPAARADLLARLGRGSEAGAAYESAIALTDNDASATSCAAGSAETVGAARNDRGHGHGGVPDSDRRLRNRVERLRRLRRAAS
jgi:hypothetical protein